MTFQKNDHDKIRFTLLDVSALTEMARAMEHGAEKYGKDNWRAGCEWSRYVNATLRHLYAFLEGVEEDEDSGLHPLAHAMASLHILSAMVKRDIGTDDRGPK